MKKLLLLTLFLAGCINTINDVPPSNTLSASAPQSIALLPAPTYDNLDLGLPVQQTNRYPCSTQVDQVINREGYALGFSQTLMQPLWVTYRLTDSEVTNRVVKRTGYFMQDNYIEGVSAYPEDYFRTGYDRGHLAPAADFHWSTNAMLESFYMSNMSPQTPALNRYTWASAEAFARECAVKEGSVFIVTGPICTNENPKTIGISNVVVPDAFYKVIYDEVPPEKMIAFVMPNGKPDLNMWLYATNVAYVEEVTGLRFFTNLETNKLEMLKIQCNTNEWARTP